MAVQRHELMKMRWNDFSTYPDQGDDIYLHCVGAGTEVVHRFLRLSKFNAVTFDFRKICGNLGRYIDWRFYWLPAKQIDKRHGK